MEGYTKYQSRLAHDAPKDAQPVHVYARRLEGKESIKCPKTQKVWTGGPGDYVIKLPDGKRQSVLKRAAKDGAKPIEVVVEGAMYVVNATVFNNSYEVSKAAAASTAESKGAAAGGKPAGKK